MVSDRKTTKLRAFFTDETSLFSIVNCVNASACTFNGAVMLTHKHQAGFTHIRSKSGAITGVTCRMCHSMWEPTLSQCLMRKFALWKTTLNSLALAWKPLNMPTSIPIISSCVGGEQFAEAGQLSLTYFCTREQLLGKMDACQ